MRGDSEILLKSLLPENPQRFAICGSDRFQLWPSALTTSVQCRHAVLCSVYSVSTDHSTAPSTIGESVSAATQQSPSTELSRHDFKTGSSGKLKIKS